MLFFVIIIISLTMANITYINLFSLLSKDLCVEPLHRQPDLQNQWTQLPNPWRTCDRGHLAGHKPGSGWQCTCDRYKEV